MDYTVNKADSFSLCKRLSDRTINPGIFNNVIQALSGWRIVLPRNSILRIQTGMMNARRSVGVIIGNSTIARLG